MAEEQAEIISRPPSHPIATTLLVVSMLATIIAIAFVWAELFGEYLPADRPGQPRDPKHDSRTIAEQHVHDHYRADFGTSDDVLSEVEKELGISSSVGGDDGLGGGGGGG